MKKSVYNHWNIKILLLLVIVMSSSILSARDYTKEVLRNFKVNADAKFVLNNSRGNVNITTWDKNTIKIEAEIVVNAKDATQAESFFKQIKIDFDHNSGYVKVTTLKEKQEESWKDWLFGATPNWKWSVNYRITIPRTNSLSATGKLGDMYVSNVKGKTTINHKFGNFKLSKFDQLTCDLSHGDGTVSEVNDLTIDVKYCDIKLRGSKNIDMTSKHSEIDIDEASDIRSVSRYDDYEIGAVKTFNSTGKFDDFMIGKVGTINAVGKNSDFDIESILESGDFNVEYGEVIIQNLSTSLEKLILVGEHTEFFIDTEGGSFNLVLDGNATDVETPKDMNTTSKERQDNVLKLKGKVGTGASNSLIEVRTKYGSLKIIQQ